jgi:hypothetical protein
MPGKSKLFGLGTLLLAVVLSYQSWTLSPSLSLSGQQYMESGTADKTQQEVFCETPAYKVRILSYYPLIIHLQDFITPRERVRLLQLR